MKLAKRFSSAIIAVLVLGIIGGWGGQFSSLGIPKASQNEQSTKTQIQDHAPKQAQTETQTNTQTKLKPSDAAKAAANFDNPTSR